MLPLPTSSNLFLLFIFTMKVIYFDLAVNVICVLEPVMYFEYKPEYQFIFFKVVSAHIFIIAFLISLYYKNHVGLSRV